MRYYETLYAIRPDLEEEEYRVVVEKFTGIIEKNRGVIIKLDEWGKKKFAYLVKKFDHGFYVLMNYCGSGELPHLLERDLRLDERVLKYLTIKLKDRVDPEELLKQEAGSGPPRKEKPGEETGGQKDNSSNEKISQGNEVTDGI